MNVGYADFVLLCQVNDPDTWDDALSVREDGVYVKPLTDDCAISPEERAVLAQHPSGNLNDPALRFPCTLDDLQRFLDEHGAYGCIDAFRMARWIQAARNNGQAWRRRLAAAEYLEHGEAAGALAGINWGDPHAPLSKQDHAEWRGWFKNIDQAIRSGSLRAFHGDIDEDGNEGPLLISPSDFKAWCESKGLGDPFSPGRPSLEDGARAAPRHLVEPESNQSQMANGLQSDASLREELARAHERIKALELDRTALLKKIEATASTPITSGADSINSPTLQRILEAVVTYPTWRAAQNQAPNLKTVLNWQDEQQRGKGNASRVAYVAHHVVAEHFGLKS